MAGKHTIQVSVLADTAKASRALSDFGNNTGLSKLGGVAKKVGLAVVAVGSAAAVAAGAIAVKGVSAAADLEQSMGGVDAVFKGNAAQMKEWSAGAAQSVGLASNEYNNLAIVIGSQLKNGGTALDEIGGKTNDLVTVGADLASMFGGTTADAVGALSSALKGERDPIEKYGVSLKQATIDAKAAELGFEKVGGSLSAEANQAATLALIMEQTADAHGNFGRESDTLQNKQQRLMATLTNVSARIGAVLLPTVTALAGWVGDRLVPIIEGWVGVMERNLTPALATATAWITGTLVPGLQTLGANLKANVLPVLAAFGAYLTGTVVPAIVALAGWLIDSQDWLLPLAAGIGAMVVAWKAWTVAVQAWQLVTKLAAAAQAVLNAVLAANPIGIIVLLIVGLVAALVVLYQRNETVRRIVDAAWSGIKRAVSAVATWITGTAIPAIVGAWDKMSSVASTVASWVSGKFNAIKNGISAFAQSANAKIQSFITWMGNLASRVGSAVNGANSAVAGMARTVGTKVGQVLQFFRDLPGKIISALSSLGSRLSSSASSAVGSMASSVSSKIGTVVGYFRSLPGKIIGALSGLGSRMSGVGGQIVQGLINGIKNMAGRAANAARSVVSGAINGAKRLLGIASPSRVFRKIGEQTGEGLEIGLKATRRLVTAAAGTLATATVRAGTPGPLEVSSALLRRPGARSGDALAPVVVNVNVSGLLHPTAETGRLIAEALTPYLRRGGRLVTQ